jgi:hypothetical protein
MGAKEYTFSDDGRVPLLRYVVAKFCSQKSGLCVSVQSRKQTAPVSVPNV